eukprot:1938113-Amphidinium_carterae.1
MGVSGGPKMTGCCRHNWPVAQGSPHAGSTTQIKRSLRRRGRLTNSFWASSSMRQIRIVEPC